MHIRKLSTFCIAMYLEAWCKDGADVVHTLLLRASTCAPPGRLRVVQPRSPRIVDAHWQRLAVRSACVLLSGGVSHCGRTCLTLFSHESLQVSTTLTRIPLRVPGHLSPHLYAIRPTLVLLFSLSGPEASGAGVHGMVILKFMPSSRPLVRLPVPYRPLGL